MRRARANVERLTSRLPDLGYEFADPTRALVPPEPEIATRLGQLEATIGTLPLSLRYWYEEVGSVNLMGRHRRWRYDYADPLVVEAPLDYVLSEYEDWQADRDTEWGTDAFPLGVAPDYLHKADVSGGGPYALGVPNEGVDGPFLDEFHETTFVNYLRICFRCAGFPGWERTEPDWARPPGPLPAELTKLASELVPL